jgi:hypothetical protein
MATVAVIACDLCRTKPADTGQVLQSGQPEYLVDLCLNCFKPLRDMRKACRPLVVNRAGRRRTGVTKNVTYETPWACPEMRREHRP